MAEKPGFAPRVFRASDVAIGCRLGSGGEGRVMTGKIIGTDVYVAVKQVPLPPPVTSSAEVAAVMHVVSASYLAGVASPYVCKLHGYCWTDSELWCAQVLSPATGLSHRL